MCRWRIMPGISRWFVRRVLLVACVISFIGCGGGGKPGPKLYHIAGTVTFTGEPLKEGDLVVRSADGKHAAGSTITNGKFQFDAPAGTSIVEIGRAVQQECRDRSRMPSSA
eukprot:TRINITY_DN652_c0_g1_i10.p3 TRINITY_DN652_c0_g1~~TRINITY_DN652_c0_g1_i10.p3  ORF type:complete len:111 (+),score=26.28 TRINITY_DN652_c0_g1_i10:652-984(+)